MNNDKFVNYYMELLTSSFHDALGKNLVFQVQSRISGEEIDALKTQIENYSTVVEEYKKIEENISQTSSELISKDEEIDRLISERDAAKVEASHIDTFRNELISARNQIQEKQKEIEEIKLNFSNKEKLMMQESDRMINESRLEYEIKIKSLEEKIEYLQMTPAKRKKFEAGRLVQQATSDGGNF